MNSHWAVGLYVGACGFNDSGNIDDVAYDLKINSRSTGVTGQYYFGVVDHLSLQTSLAYANWSGSVSPSSANDEDPDSIHLGSSFDASGMTAGFAAIFTWLWDDGFYIAWTPAGMRKA